MPYNKFINATNSMSEPITTNELLQFLDKAHKVASHVNIERSDSLYTIRVHCDWKDNNHFYGQNVCITEDGRFTWRGSDYEFYTMDSALQEIVEREEERYLKRKKRHELLSRLTDEEKELLGIKS